MKAYRSIISGLAVLVLLLAVPVWAEMASVSDSDLAGITGKVNTYTFGADASISQSASGDTSANIQVGWYQWTDTHTTDTTNQKAANYFGSETAGNTAQSNVTASINAITWGATGNGELTATDVTVTGASGFANMDYAVMAVGGF